MAEKESNNAKMKVKQCEEESNKAKRKVVL
jgi:hypothetical protein